MDLADLADEEKERLEELKNQLLLEKGRLMAENAELRRRLGMDSNNGHTSPTNHDSRKRTGKRK
jgi:cell shape-determining protein MreC